MCVCVLEYDVFRYYLSCICTYEVELFIQSESSLSTEPKQCVKQARRGFTVSPDQDFLPDSCALVTLDSFSSVQLRENVH